MKLAATSFGFFAVACGGGTGQPDASVDATTTPDVTQQDALVDAAPDVEQPLEDGGLFLCFGCYCDGRNSYCRDIQGPHMPLDGDGGDASDLDAALCTTDGGTECLPYPDACAPSPTCSCLVKWQTIPACSCAEADGGGGYDVGCYIP